MNCVRSTRGGKEYNFCKGLWTWQRCENKSIIDYCLVNQRLARKVRTVTIDTKRQMPIHSDHNWIISSFNMNLPQLHWPKPEKKKWDLKKANKSEFKKNLKKQNIGEGLESKNSGIINALNEVAIKARCKLKVAGTKQKNKSESNSIKQAREKVLALEIEYGILLQKLPP